MLKGAAGRSDAGSSGFPDPRPCPLCSGEWRRSSGRSCLRGPLPAELPCGLACRACRRACAWASLAACRACRRACMSACLAARSAARCALLSFVWARCRLRFFAWRRCFFNWELLGTLFTGYSRVGRGSVLTRPAGRIFLPPVSAARMAMIPRNSTLCSRPLGRVFGKAGRPRRRFFPAQRRWFFARAS